MTATAGSPASVVDVINLPMVATEHKPTERSLPLSDNSISPNRAANASLLDVDAFDCIELFRHP